MSIIEVAIGAAQKPGSFLVRVLNSPVGEASAVTELEVGELLSRRVELQEAVLASAVTSRRVLSETEVRVRGVGHALFTALLGAGEVAGRYRAAAAVAAERGDDLRVVLRIDDPLLAGLPWEAMYDEAAGAYVCRRDQLVRHVPVASAAASLKVDLPLRILGVVSSPRGLPSLDVGRERELLDTALSRLTGAGLAEVTWAPSAQWADLQDLLLGEKWHVVHFIGHGDFDPDRDEGVLALTGADGRADMVEASRLVDLLRQARPIPRLVVLNSCSGAAVGATDLFSGTAAALVRGGVSAVAAMQYEISDPAAAAFARGFYGAIACGRGVDDAVSSGRVGIMGLSSRTLEWLTPVLYLRGHDSHLFTLSAPPKPMSRESQPVGIGTAPAVRDGRSAPVVPDSDPVGRDSTPRAPARKAASVTSKGQVRRQLRAPVPSRPVATLSGHTEPVRCVTFSPDGRLLASASDDLTIRLWDAGTGEEVRRMGPCAAHVSSVAFSPDGSLLASADVKPNLWNAKTGVYVRGLPGLEGYVMDVLFSPDGNTVASTGGRGEIGLWRPAGSFIHSFEVITDQQNRRVPGAAFSPDGRLLATAGDKRVSLWDPGSGMCKKVLTGHRDYSICVAFSPDGRLLASGARDKEIRLWDVVAGKSLQCLTGNQSWVESVAFSPDGSLLASTGDDEVRIWNVATGKLQTTLSGHTESGTSVAFSPDGKLLASAARDQTVRLWA